MTEDGWDYFKTTIHSEDLGKPGTVLKIYNLLNEYFTSRETLLGVHANIKWRKLLKERGDIFFIDSVADFGPYMVFLQTDPNREAPTKLELSLTFPPYGEKGTLSRERKLIADIRKHVNDLLEQEGLEAIAIG